MKLNKIIILILFLILISPYAAAQDEGCCINPKADRLLRCNTYFMQDIDDCCPDQTNFPNYYYSANMPYGPANQASCRLDYFRLDTSCDALPYCIDYGCCCSPTGVQYVLEHECSPLYNFVKGPASLGECAGECAALQCSDGADNDNDGCRDLADPGCENSSDSNEGPFNPECAGIGDCDSVNYAPALGSLQIQHMEGEKKFTLTWSDTCRASYYLVYRCEGNDCVNFNLIAKPSANIFIDDSPGLKWGATYTYKINAHYSAQGDVEANLKGINALGNLECWHRNWDESFCIQLAYYMQYSEYMSANGILPEQTKFNKAWKCNHNNLLEPVSVSGPGTSNDCGSQTCVAQDGEANCIDGNECKEQQGNPFGLYYSAGACEDSFCFFDRSFTSVDYCYSCNAYMSCYDYKSKSACERDNCAIGEGMCRWRETIPGIGIGVCVNLEEDNCAWCNSTGTPGIENARSYNSVFDQCTQEKSDQLVVPGNKCFFKNGRSISCNYLTCSDYTQTECGLGVREFGPSNNLISSSNDPCNISVCQWEATHGKCYKNADGLLNFNGESISDCEITSSFDVKEKACELDHFPPETNITASISRGIYELLLINIKDKVRGDKEAVSILSDVYKTYLCRAGSNTCINHPYSIYTNSTVLLINNENDLGLYEARRGAEARLLFNLTEGANTLKYYSQDKSKNLGIVKEIIVRAYRNASGPTITDMEVEGGMLFNDTYYTNNKRPNVIVRFLSDAKLTLSSLRSSSGSLVSRTISPADFSRTITIRPDNELADGKYTFNFNAENTNSIMMRSDKTITFVVDNSNAQITLKPSNNEVVEVSNVSVIIKSNEDIKIEKAELNDVNITQYFLVDTYRASFNTSVYMTDGTKTLRVHIRDRANNLMAASSMFDVNAVPVFVNITKPSYGVANDSTFDIEAVTDNDAACKWSFGSDTAPEYRFMEDFHSTTGRTHTINNFNRIPDGSIVEYPFFITCNDPVWGLNTAEFKLRVDVSPPVIITAYADPNPIVEDPPNTTLKAQTNEPTLCRYSEDRVEYENMENSFEFYDYNFGFRTVNTKKITAPRMQGSYTYNVRCIDKAGWISNLGVINFSVNLEFPLQITDNTRRYGNSTTHTLAIGVNKIAQCKYSATDSTVTTGTLFGDPSYSHTKAVSVPGAGDYRYYVKCRDQFLNVDSNVVGIVFTIDATPPSMIYVNDTSSLLSYPEFTSRTDGLRVKWLCQDNETGVS